MQILNTSKWYLHPVFIFACSIMALATALIITTYWYMEITAALEIIIMKFNIDPRLIFPSKTGMIFFVLTLLIIVVLAGIFMAFIYYQRTLRLFRLQHNFINNFTHELKTPVTSLKLYLETFLRHRLDMNDIKKYSQFMLTDVARLSKNINSILNLARIESGSYGAEFSNEDLVDVVQRFCDSNKTLFRNCLITLKIPEKAKFIYPVNKSLFDMLLMNIISNAVKYNNSETPEIRISFRPHTHKQKLLIAFKDNGIGIEKKEINKIFRKFYQTAGSEYDSIEGSGLGLYLVYNITKIHGWKIKAHSDGKNKGSTFILSLPEEDAGGVKRKNPWKMLKKNVSWS